MDSICLFHAVDFIEMACIIENIPNDLSDIDGVSFFIYDWIKFASIRARLHLYKSFLRTFITDFYPFANNPSVQVCLFFSFFLF